MCVLLVLERRGAALEGEAGEAAAAECRVCALCGSEFKIMGWYNRFFKRFFADTDYSPDCAVRFTGATEIVMGLMRILPCVPR